jgi:4-amino-4-deoxy-L-arabinose transferase-like glycosyltransferase
VLADEADNAQDAVRILYGQTPANGFFGLDWTSQPAFSAYKEAAFIYIFGFNIFAMRLSSALISSLAVIPFYLLLRRQFSLVASMLATILFATNVWYLNFSRSGWNCSDAAFYMLMAMLFVMWALDAFPIQSRSHRWRWFYFAAAGFFCALGLYGYPAGRAVTVAMIAFVPIALLFNRQHYKSLLLGFGLLFAVEAALFAPQGLYVAKNWEHFNGRSNVVLIFNKEEFKTDPTSTMFRQLDRNIRGPWDGRVNNTPQYSPVGEPQLDRITGILVLIGMVLSLVRGVLRQQPETWLWWLMLLAGWGLTQLFTVNTPNGARGMGYMPTLIYFAGVSLDALVKAVRRVSVRFSEFSFLTHIAQAALIVFILFAGYNNIKHYIDWQNTPRTRQDRYLYVTAREFPQWSAAIIDRAKNKQGIINVGQWRELHPIQDIAHPYPDPMQ